jgi:hypothetical protein
MDETTYSVSISLPKNDYGVGDLNFHHDVYDGDGGTRESLASPPEINDTVATNEMMLWDWYEGDGCGYSQIQYSSESPTKNNGDGGSK